MNKSIIWHGTFNFKNGSGDLRYTDYLKENYLKNLLSDSQIISYIQGSLCNTEEDYENFINYLFTEYDIPTRPKPHIRFKDCEVSYVDGPFGIYIKEQEGTETYIIKLLPNNYKTFKKNDVLMTSWYRTYFFGTDPHFFPLFKDVNVRIDHKLWSLYRKYEILTSSYDPPVLIDSELIDYLSERYGVTDKSKLDELYTQCHEWYKEKKKESGLEGIKMISIDPFAYMDIKYDGILVLSTNEYNYIARQKCLVEELSTNVFVFNNEPDTVYVWQLKKKALD